MCTLLVGRMIDLEFTGIWSLFGQMGHILDGAKSAGIPKHEDVQFMAKSRKCTHCVGLPYNIEGGLESYISSVADGKARFLQEMPRKNYSFFRFLHSPSHCPPKTG